VAVSRDEAREIGVMALLLAVGLRFASGFVQLVEELDREWTVRSAIGRFVSPVGTTTGMLIFGAAFLVLLSPSGSIGGRLHTWTTWIAGLIAALAVISVINSFSLGLTNISSRIWFTLLDPAGAALLGATAWWLLRNLDTRR